MRPILYGRANLFRGFEAVGGRLTLNSECLVFTPHVLNIQRQAETIALEEIDTVEKTNTLGLIPNGMKVITAEKEYRFVVRKRQRWINKINNEIETHTPQAA